MREPNWFPLLLHKNEEAIFMDTNDNTPERPFSDVPNKPFAPAPVEGDNTPEPDFTQKPEAAIPGEPTGQNTYDSGR